MAEHLAKLAELRSLPPELHWFCDTYASSRHDLPRIKSEHPIGENLKLRREQVCESLQLFAYDDAQQYQDELAKDLDIQLSRCDLCVVGYYKSRQHLVEKLRHDYDTEEVVELVNIFNARDFTRIKRGLDTANMKLKRAEPSSRSKDTLDLPSQLALFEALSSEAFLADETLLSEHFQEPFKLVQTNRRLKITQYVPAATIFLLDKDSDRWTWATHVWSKYSSIPSEEDFNFAIRDPLLRDMQRASEGSMDRVSVQRLWYGIGLILKKLDNDLVTHSLRAMEIDVFRLALEHLKYDNDGLRFLIQTIQTLLELAPKDFWDSMGAISPTTFIEQIFNNRQYDRFMEQAHESERYESSPLHDMLSWIKPFMTSLETVHQARACRSLAFQLLDRLQVDRFPLHARLECKRIGLATLSWTLSNCSKEGATLSHTGRVVAAETLEVASDYIKDIINIPSLPADDDAQKICADTCLRIIKTALALECKSLRTDQEALRQNKELPDGYASYSPAIWDAVVQHLDRGNLTVARAALVGINDLTGLEKFKVNPDEAYRKEKNGFNVKFGRLTHLVCQILERINDFKPSDLDKLFRHSDTATALVASLFSPDASLYEAGVNLIKSISSESARKEAIGHLLKTFLETTLNAFSWAIRRIARNRTFASCPMMLKTSADVLDILCDSQNGLLRTRMLSSAAETKAVENFWEYQWEGLKVIYEMTENWGRTKVAEASVLKEFCRDTMQFSERFFDQYSVFATGISSSVPIKQEGEALGGPGDREAGRDLLGHPAMVLEAMVKWLRLRDAFLIEISVKLTTKVLDRLTELGMTISPGPCDFLEQILINGAQTRSNLQPQEKAELARALEANLGRSVLSAEIDREQREPLSDHSRGHSFAVTKTLKAGTIDLDSWKAKAKISDQVVELSDDEFAESELNDRDLLSVSRSAELMKGMEASIAERDRHSTPRERKALEVRERQPALATRESKTAKVAKASVQSDVERALFREKREKEREAKKKRDAETLARVKKRAGLSGSAIGEGSSLAGIGVRGKDHAPKGQSMMVSSGSESESEDELDRGLFEDTPKTANLPNDDRFFKPSNRLPAQIRGPVKKMRQARSAKDMRARLAPDLTPLHKTILGWDFFHDGDFPPGSDRDNYSLVTSTFRTPVEYQNTFEPLLVLEAWQGFLKSKEEGNFKTFEVKVANRMNVDAFLELSTTMPMAEAKELGIGEADIVLMSKGQSPSAEVQQPHCLARVWKTTRKKATMDITYRANVGNGLVASMVPNATLFGVKVSSITPLEREYGALLGLKYFDLCDEIIRAKPSPLLDYSDKQLAPLLANYNINIAQAKAVKSAIDNDAFTLIQGPPGSGKTKTIVAIVGALLTGTFMEKGVPIARPQLNEGSAQRSGNACTTKKLLVCAPSNAAVDELVMRFKEGVKTADGTIQKLSVIRLGRSDAINANVLDVTLDELVNAKLNIASGKNNSAGDDIHRIMMAHKATSEELITLRTQVEELKASGKPVSSDQDRQFEVLKRTKQQLSNQIDTARDSGDVAARDAELNRRRVQQDILNDAHVICATLSGSGHEMFQNLNIEFETVVIDEAAQSIELSALIPLKYGCSKCILVGDPKQLPPTVLSREAARFQYEQSLFVRLQSNHPKDVHLLDTQYRMHPEISVFPSNAFYDARLLDGPGMAELRTRPWHQSKVLGPYRFFEVQGHHQSAPRGHSLINLAEIDVALRLFDRLITDCRGYDFKGKVGIITPYKSQLRELRSRFAHTYGETVFATVEFNTTDAFQGRESEIIIFSCVRASVSKGIGFLSDIRRMNVGITRAKCSLWVLGNSQSLMQGEFWGRLVQDAKSRDRYTSGDMKALLGKPLLTLDSRALAAMNRPSPLTSTTSSSGRDIDMPNAPILCGYTATGSSSSRSSGTVGSPGEKHLLDEAEPLVYHPAGGANGLNPNGNCQKCGSFTHFTNHCTNTDAKAQAGGQCFRCNRDGHSKAFCTTERCLVCGEFGHLQRTCISTKPLLSKDKYRISKQEAEHKSLLQRAAEMHKKRQLGDHDKQVPIVRATPSTPPPDNASRNGSGLEQRTGEKRRRGSSPPASAPKGPKVRKDAKEALGSSQQKPVRPPSNAKQPLSKLPNGVSSREGRGCSTHETVFSKVVNKTAVLSRPNDLAAIADARQASKNTVNSRENTLPPRRPSSASDSMGSKEHLPSLRHTGDGYRLGDGSNAGQASGHSALSADRLRPGNGASTILEASGGPRGDPGPRPPPPMNMVKPPRKKKEVDPFIKPKRRV